MSRNPTDESPLMLGVSGLRGIVGASLTDAVAARFAGAFSGWLHERAASRPPRVAVGRDGRAGGQDLARVVLGALANTGCVALDAGVAMTPTMGVAVDRLGLDGAVVVTASHNPAAWNGLKLLLAEPGGACAPSAATAGAIIGRFHSSAEPTRREGGRVDRLDAVTEGHVGLVLRALGDGALARIKGRGLRAVVDSVNCSGATGAAGLLGRLGVACEPLFADGSGLFPHTPEPTAENLSGPGGLCEAVPKFKADIGLAQDPDGDRLALIDERGRYIGEEYTLALCARALLAGGPAGALLAANLSTSRMIDDIAARHGAGVVRTAVGEANVVEAMKQRPGAMVLGGEGNGGVIWPAVTMVRDSLSSMALVLDLMARTGRRVSELVAEMPAYAIEKRKQPLGRKDDAAPTLERIAARYAAERVDVQDGVRVDFDARRAWVHVRASNTEPILRLIAEAETPGDAGAILDEVATLARGTLADASERRA